jgi:hypothetical protein
LDYLGVLNRPEKEIIIRGENLNKKSPGMKGVSIND